MIVSVLGSVSTHASFEVIVLSLKVNVVTIVRVLPSADHVATDFEMLIVNEIMK